MVRPRKLVVLAGAAAGAAALAAVRYGRRATRGHQVAGGILVGDAVVYDALSRLLLGPLVARIAADVAAVAPAAAQVLEVGCGPGHLSVRLARHHGLAVTGLDLDPAMIARARANGDRPDTGDQRRPSFLVGDVAALAFPDASFDLVVSTLSMHHWADPAAGLAEIGRVLRPGARALIWDFQPGARPHPFGPRHAHMPDPADHTHSSPDGERDAMAMALEVRAHPAGPVDPGRWGHPGPRAMKRHPPTRALAISHLGRLLPTCGYQLTTARTQERCEQRASRRRCPVCREDT